MLVGNATVEFQTTVNKGSLEATILLLGVPLAGRIEFLRIVLLIKYICQINIESLIFHEMKS